MGLFNFIFEKIKHLNKKIPNDSIDKQQIDVGLDISIVASGPTEEEWEKMRRAKEKAKEDSINALKSNFVFPSNMMEATTNMEMAISLFANLYNLSSPNFSKLWAEIQSENPKKTELKIRKKISETYKNRAESSQLVESLAYCLLHVQWMIENKSLAWNGEISIKRLANNLKHEKYYQYCIGFLHTISNETTITHTEISNLCRETVDHLFFVWHEEIQEGKRYKNIKNILSSMPPSSEKHFFLNGVVEYYNRKRRFDPSIKDDLIYFCKEDVKLYKLFLTSSNDIYKKGRSFEQVVRSKYYICPRLPSFDILVLLYEEENNKNELLSLKKLGKKIKYFSKLTLEEG